MKIYSIEFAKISVKGPFYCGVFFSIFPAETWKNYGGYAGEAFDISEDRTHKHRNCAIGFASHWFLFLFLPVLQFSHDKISCGHSTCTVKNHPAIRDHYQAYRSNYDVSHLFIYGNYNGCTWFFASLQALDHFLDVIWWNYFVISLSMQHEQAAQCVSSQFQMCINDFWTIETERHHWVEGRGWFWRRAVALGQPVPRAAKSRAQRGRILRGGHHKRGTISSPLSGFSTKVNKAGQWHTEQPRRSLAQVEFIGPFDGFNGVPKFWSIPRLVSSDKVCLLGSLRKLKGFSSTWLTKQHG